MNIMKLVRGMKRPFLPTYTATCCGHKTKLEDEVTIFGSSYSINLPLEKDGTVEYCAECYAKMSIKCAWCQGTILIGEPVTLYTPVEPDFKVPEHAVVFKKDPLQLVGCLRWDCASTGADRAGFWVPGKDGHGKVRRVPTAFELILSSPTPSAVIVSDLSDMAEARNQTLIPLETKSE